MPKSIKKENRKGSLVYTSAVFFLLSGLSFFIPFCSYQDEYGVTVGLTSYKILIGGEDTFYLNSHLYSFSYKLNIPLLLMLQLCLLSIVASIFGKRDKTNLDISWIKDESLESLENLPEPQILASEIVGNLQNALTSFKSVMDSLKNEEK